jgi:microcystin-dependent protein
MATANKGFVQPALGSIGWGLPLNDDFGGIDAAFGSVTTLSVTGQTATPIVLTLAQYVNMTIKFTGVLTANVTYQLPAGVGGQWVVQRATTGAFTITIASLGGGTSKILDADFSDIVCDGVDCAGNFGSLPSGSIMIWSGSQATIPVGWLLCNGTLGTPDLRDRFVTGAGSTYAVGGTGGVTTVTLTQAQTPAHVHSFSGNTNTDGAHVHNITDPGHTHTYATKLGTAGGIPFGSDWDSALTSGTGGAFTGVGIQNSVSHTHTFTTTSTPIGGDGSHATLPPYYALCYIYKI